MSNYAVSRIHIKIGIGVTCTSCGARVNFVKISAMKKTVLTYERKEKLSPFCQYFSSHFDKICCSSCPHNTFKAVQVYCK